MKYALKNLTRALARLRADQTAGRRTAARRLVGAAIRVLKLRVDEQFPRIVKVSSYKAPHGSAASRAAQKRIRLMQRGYKVAPAPYPTLALEAGVRAIRTEAGLMLPGWCFAVDSADPKAAAQLRRAKSDRTFRLSLTAAAAFR